MKNWYSCNLGEIAIFKNGKSSPLRGDDNKFPVFGSNGIIGFSNDYNSNNGTIIIGRVGSFCGSIYYYDKQCWVTDNAIIGKSKKNSDSKFLYYLLSNVGLNNYKSGSGQPLLNQRTLNEIEMTVPEIKEQKIIASILSSLDDKIELNRKMNQTLEQIAQAIFKHWFIDFEFPNEEGKPYKSSGGEMVDSELGLIPNCWKVENFVSIAELAYGKGLKADLRIAGNFPVVGSNGIIDYHNNYLVKAPGIVIGRKGTIGTVIWIDDNFWPIDTTFYVKSKKREMNLYYIYFLLKNLKLDRISSDSAVPGLNRNFAYVKKIVIPSSNLLDGFNEFCRPLFNKIKILEKEIQTLIKLRDSLLPKLISGKIRVKTDE